ncbi:MAG: hypothetical protein KKD73_06505 [Proteobacteria bacterium]|nr:hypothetical protein [Pseudomonadota bacterium]MBU1639189.1 hypothetical protein [Pseudomonadota bacterium]
MSRQLSFTKFEKELLPDFRQKINMAESSEDVKTFYARTSLALFDKAFDNAFSLEFNDIMLQPGNTEKYVLSDRLRSSPSFTEIWNTSDLPNILGRFTDVALNRYTHLEKHPEKTDSKIRM